MTYLPYPEARYQGTNGEPSAGLRRAETAPELVNPSGTAVHYLATGAGTDGQLGLYRWEMGPGRGGPDPHFHRSITESFYVLSGTIRLHDGTDWVDGHPGDFLYVPQGGVHGFRNESGAPAAMLILFHARRSPRGLFRAGRHGRRHAGERAGRVLPPARHLLGLRSRSGRPTVSRPPRWRP